MITYKKLIKYFSIFLVVGIGVVLILRIFVNNNVKDSEPYKVAVKFATEDVNVKHKTGGVEGIGHNIAYNIKQTTAYMTFVVKGKNQDVNVYCYLSLKNNLWHVDKMEYN